MTPEVAVEVQEFWLMKDTKARDFRDSQQTERRRTPRPRHRRWWLNDAECKLARELRG